MLTIPIDSQLSTPLYQQIYSFLKEEIKTHRLSFHTKLPSTRKLAQHLNISRNTVDMAYEQLVSEGYIEAFPRKGYFVNRLSDIAYLSIKPNRENIVNKKIVQSYQYDFSPFTIDLEKFPYQTWRKLSKACLSSTNDLFLLGENQGDYKLRYAIQKYLHQSRGVNCSEEQIIIGAGNDYLLQLLSQLIDKTTTIAIENPSYCRAYQIFSGFGFDVNAISLDKNGIIIKELAASCANIVYVTPSHQYPLGIIIPISRRLELLHWALEKENRYIIEDDHDSEFRYKGKPIPCLQGIDSNDKVIYLGTFSKAIAPAIRIAYMVLPFPLLTCYKENYSYYSSTVSRIDQAIITSFIEDGYFERHLNHMRTHYKNKHDTVITALKIFGNKIRIYGENAGLHLVIEFYSKRKELEIIDKAKQNNICLYPLSDHYIIPCPAKNPTILLGYAALSEEKLKQGIYTLYQCLKNFI